MLEIKKIETEFGYWFDIIINNEIFNIYFMGNLDLYWNYQYNGNILDCDDSKYFIITKENYFLYNLFDKLYNDIKNYQTDTYSYDLLFHDNKVEWRSDDCFYEEASRFVIEPMDRAYKLTFKIGLVDNFLTYSVRIRNSGSRYNPFNMFFMDMYNQLCEYELNYHQIHMEEYLYQKKLIKKKETI